MNKTRTLNLIWRAAENEKPFIVGRLNETNGEYRFEYDEDGVRLAKKHGFKPIVYFPNIRAEYKNTRLFPAIAMRLPDKRRNDVKELMRKHNLSDYDGFELLRITKGKLPTDNIEFLPPME